MKKIKKVRVGIIGCGVIFDRHVDAIKANEKYCDLVAICDIDEKKVTDESKKYSIPGFTGYKKFLKVMNGKMDLVSICTPNNLHFQQAIDSLEAGFDILVEKPIDFSSTNVKKIVKKANKLNKNAYAVLQVRYNPTISMVREALSENIIGDVKAVSLIQRWQRPASYFDSWRSDIKIGGRILYEVGIHYLDILQWLFGIPQVFATKTFKHKHKNVNFEDTVYSLVAYPNGASGSIEVTIAAEPTNLECSIAIMGSRGFIKIGGKALNEIEKVLLPSGKIKDKWLKITKKYGQSLKPNSYGTHLGSCPNHPILYKEIFMGRGINIGEAVNSIEFIKSIYKKELR